MASKTQQFSVTATPEDAVIVINGQMRGKGHATTEVKRDSSVAVMVSRKGCQTMHRQVQHSINGLGILDGVGTVLFIVPAFGLASAGAYSLDEDSIHFSLMCDEEVETTENIERVEEAKSVEEVNEAKQVKTNQRTLIKTNEEAIVISTGASRLVSASPEDWIDAVVSVSTVTGGGSGFVISEDLIMTNQHIVGDSDSVLIKSNNGLQSIGKVIASDSRRDIALVKMKAKLPKYLNLSTTEPELGTVVYVVGNPVTDKAHSTISRGIINALRVVKNQTIIQSDVNIHSGDSGTPLLDKSGTVVGIAASKFAVKKTSQGTSFFVPIDDALKSLKKI
jgi:S1-C subfamily serine protease